MAWDRLRVHSGVPNTLYAMENIAGKWHISYSTLSLWESAKADPAITYRRESNNTWTDQVDYVEEKGSYSRLSPVTVHGVNTVSRHGTLRWRGKGFYSIFRCTCKLLAHDPCMQEYVVLHFGPTLFTDSGLDILTRERELPEERLHEILAHISSRDPAVKALLAKGRLRPTKRVSELPGQRAAATQAAGQAKLQPTAPEAAQGRQQVVAGQAAACTAALPVAAAAQEQQQPTDLQMTALGQQLQALRYSAPAALEVHKVGAVATVVAVAAEPGEPGEGLVQDVGEVQAGRAPAGAAA